MDLCCFLQVTGGSHAEVVRAVKNIDFKDFEDCRQDRGAVSDSCMGLEINKQDIGVKIQTWHMRRKRTRTIWK